MMSYDKTYGSTLLFPLFSYDHNHIILLLTWSNQSKKNTKLQQHQQHHTFNIYNSSSKYWQFTFERTAYMCYQYLSNSMEIKDFYIYLLAVFTIPIWTSMNLLETIYRARQWLWWHILETFNKANWGIMML